MAVHDWFSHQKTEFSISFQMARDVKTYNLRICFSKQFGSLIEAVITITEYGLQINCQDHGQAIRVQYGEVNLHEKWRCSLGILMPSFRGSIAYVSVVRVDMCGVRIC